MTPTALLDLLARLDTSGAAYWLDGGWGVDALLGEQTREHGDVDLVVHRDDLAVVRALLEGEAYVVLRDWLPVALAFGHPDGREVELHPVDPTPDGGGDQVLVAPGLVWDGPPSWHYGPPVTGSVAGRPVRCCGAAEQVAMRFGYEPRPVDRADVRRLVERFGVAAPPWLDRPAPGSDAEVVLTQEDPSSPRICPG